MIEGKTFLVVNNGKCMTFIVPLGIQEIFSEFKITRNKKPVFMIKANIFLEVTMSRKTCQVDFFPNSAINTGKKISRLKACLLACVIVVRPINAPAQSFEQQSCFSWDEDFSSFFIEFQSWRSDIAKNYRVERQATFFVSGAFLRSMPYKNLDSEGKNMWEFSQATASENSMIND